MVNLTNILKERKKIDINAFQYGIHLANLDRQRGMDRTRIFSNPTFKNKDISLGYLEVVKNGKKENS